MARRRKQSLLDRLADVSIISLIFNPVTLMVVVCFVAMLLWNQYHTKLDLRINQTISHKTLKINQKPDWIRTDLRRIAIQESRLDEIPISQQDAVELVAASFAVQPWIKSVQQVSKTTSGIKVQLEYRHPLALVDVGQGSPVPVDTEGVVLDGRDFQNVANLDYWRISLRNVLTTGLATGRQWQEMRVNDCIAIANAWHGKDRVGMFRIVNRSYPTRDRLRLTYYELWTKRGGIIIWGNPPGHEAPGEANAKQKIAAIQHFIDQHGPLDAQTNRVFDVRNGTLERSNAKLARDTAEFIHF